MTASGLRLVSQTPTPFPPVSTRSTVWDPALNGALLPNAAVERLSEPGALAVTTGQQPGLFGGPLYTVHKAMAARALALALEKQWSRPVVPIFWLAGDDHDWTEATTGGWWSEDGEGFIKWTLPPKEHSAAQLPMSREVLPHDVLAARHSLASELPPGDNRDMALAWVDRHWQPGATVHGAFAGSMAELLEPFGVVCFDPTSPIAKRAQRPLIRKALQSAIELDRTIASLPDAGTGISAGDGATLVFLETESGRDRLVAEGDQFRARRGGELFDSGELLDLLEDQPERFSANVLLRPVVEAALIPTVAYVAGPGEFRYLTHQATSLYQPLSVSQQRPVPRWSGTVVDHVADRLLGRLSISARDVIADDGSLSRSILMRDMPPEVVEAIHALNESVESAVQAIQPVGANIDPVLVRAIESRRRKLLHVTADLQDLMERHLRKRDGIAFRQFERLRSRLVPLDKPQERIVSVAAALGRWGTEWLDAAAVEAESWAGKSLVVPPGSS